MPSEARRIPEQNTAPEETESSTDTRFELEHKVVAILEAIRFHPRYKEILADPLVGPHINDLTDFARAFHNSTTTREGDYARRDFAFALGELREGLIKYEGMVLPKDL